MKSSSALAINASRGFEGLIHGATLADLVQMECLRHTTRAVRVDRGESSGRIFFAAGDVVHAEAGELRGDAALFEILTWPDGSFAIEEGMRPYEATITGHWQSLLMVAAHRHDELLASSAQPNQPNITVSTMPTLKDSTVQEVFADPEVVAAVHFAEDGSLFDDKGSNPEDLHATFSYVVQLARLIGESLGAENLREIQISAPRYRSLCVIDEVRTVALLATAKANLGGIVRKLTE